MVDRRIVAALTLLAGLPARAQVDPQWYTAHVCNAGSIAVDVATAYREFYPFKPGHYWVVDRWYHVGPNSCKQVFRHQYGSNNVLSYQTFPLHLAFAFTDSTGVWGAARITTWKGPDPAKPSRLQLCVSRDDQKYAVENHDDPATACRGRSGMFLIPASIDFEPDDGNDYNPYLNEYRRRQFTISLGPNDRAIALGPQEARRPGTSDPGTTDQFIRLLIGIGMKRQQLVGGNYPEPGPGYRLLHGCIDRQAIDRESLADPRSARARAIADGVRRFVDSHDGKLNMRIREAGDGFVMTDMTGKDCPGGAYEFELVTTASNAPSARPTTRTVPSAPPAPPAPARSTTDGGFGDLITPGAIGPPRK